jgi:hypothetical protein
LLISRRPEVLFERTPAACIHTPLIWLTSAKVLGMVAEQPSISGKMWPLYVLNVLLGQDMSVVVNTNIASMRAQRSVASSGKDLQQAMERLSSGKRINSAADDAAGFAIAERMTS